MILCCKKNISINVDLDDATINTPLFSIKGRMTNAKCVKCINFGNIDLVFYFHHKLVRWKCTITNKTDFEFNSLEEDILNKTIFIKCVGFDRKERLLVHIFR